MIKRSTLSGNAIPEAILFQVRKLKLLLEKLVGQGYDEYSAMSGKFKVAQAIIEKVISASRLCALHCSRFELQSLLVA